MNIVFFFILIQIRVLFRLSTNNIYELKLCYISPKEGCLGFIKYIIFDVKIYSITF